MNILAAIFLGAVQGLTEFLPISSSGHLVLLQKTFGMREPPVFFDILLHVGTLFSVLVFLRKELTAILKNILAKDAQSFKLLRNIIVATLPAIAAGLLAANFLKEIFNSFFVVGVSYLLTALLLFWSRTLGGTNLVLSDLKPKNALVAGLFQAIAILPGVSRSGASIIGGLTQKLNRESAFLFSFYMFFPAVLGAVVLEARNFSGEINIAQGGLGTLTAFAVGYASLKVLKKILIGGKLHYFSVYCFVLGIFSLFLHFAS